MQNWKDQRHDLTNTLLSLILIIGLAISAKTLFLAALAWGLLFFLHEAPLYLKRIPILRNVLEGLFLLAAALLGFVTFGAPMIGFPTSWLLWLWIGAILFSVFVEFWRRPATTIL